MLRRYNIFVTTNISTGHPEERISYLLSLIGQPARVQILLVIGAQEACVCHMEAFLGLRQASISQHLMVLRKAGIVVTHRVGRNIFYHLAQPGIIPLLNQAALLVGIDPDELHARFQQPIQPCSCPHCNPGLDPTLTCQVNHPSSMKKSQQGA